MSKALIKYEANSSRQQQQRDLAEYLRGAFDAAFKFREPNAGNRGRGTRRGRANAAVAQRGGGSSRARGRGRGGGRQAGAPGPAGPVVATPNPTFVGVRDNSLGELYARFEEQGAMDVRSGFGVDGYMDPTRVRDFACVEDVTDFTPGLVAYYYPSTQPPKVGTLVAVGFSIVYTGFQDLKAEFHFLVTGPKTESEAKAIRPAESPSAAQYAYREGDGRHLHIIRIPKGTFTESSDWSATSVGNARAVAVVELKLPRMPADIRENSIIARVQVRWLFEVPA